MNSLWQNISFKMLRSGSRLYQLIAVNVIVFLAINIPAVLEWLFTGTRYVIDFYTNDYLALPSHLHTLLTRFWTPLTYMFMHAGILHILFNMLWLYWFGQIFEEFLGNKRLLGLYLLGGFAGAVFFVAAYNLFPAFTSSGAYLDATVVGASASVMAIIVATATQLPNYTIPLMFIGPVKLKWIAMFIVVMDFILIAGANAGGEIAHMGGALFGFIYIKQLQRGNDWVAAIAGIFKSRRKLSNLKVAARNSGKKASVLPRQEEIDRILDKISVTGYDSLTKEEKEILFRASKNES
jgi:membrane associated rhomboid family serine protease